MVCSTEKGKITHEYGLSYASDIPYYTLQEMKQSVENAHKLFQRELDMFDTMYYLKLISNLANLAGFDRFHSAVSCFLRIVFGSYFALIIRCLPGFALIR